MLPIMSVFLARALRLRDTCRLSRVGRAVLASSPSLLAFISIGRRNQMSSAGADMAAGKL